MSMIKNSFLFIILPFIKSLTPPNWLNVSKSYTKLLFYNQYRIDIEYKC